MTGSSQSWLCFALYWLTFLLYNNEQFEGKSGPQKDQEKQKDDTGLLNRNEVHCILVLSNILKNKK